MLLDFVEHYYIMELQIKSKDVIAVEKQRLSIVVKQNNLFKKMIFVLSLLIILISILLAVFGVKYNKTKKNLKTVAAQKAAVEQSLSERESLFADERAV